MTAELKSSLVTSVQAAAAQAGLVLVSATEGRDFHGQPTAVFQLGLKGGEAAGRTLRLELSEAFEFDKPDLLPTMTAHLAGEAKRLRNPRPECYVTLGGLPIASVSFSGPSTSRRPARTPTSFTARCTLPTVAHTISMPSWPPQ